jgi:hypothetical protein
VRKEEEKQKIHRQFSKSVSSRFLLDNEQNNPVSFLSHTGGKDLSQHLATTTAEV